MASGETEVSTLADGSTRAVQDGLFVTEYGAELIDNNIDRRTSGQYSLCTPRSPP